MEEIIVCQDVTVLKPGSHYQKNSSAEENTVSLMETEDPCFLP